MKKLGIALGGGGAKGVAHVLMLEALDELGWQPHCISGTSAVHLAAGVVGSQVPKRKTKRITISRRPQPSASCQL